MEVSRRRLREFGVGRLLPPRVQGGRVDEDMRGQGIGRCLVEASLELARAWGCDRLELTSRLERSGAHSFYEAVGFSHTSKRFSMPVGLRRP